MNTAEHKSMGRDIGEFFGRQLCSSAKKTAGGFTLVEMIVSIGIFTAVMFIATGALLSVVGLNKKAQAQQSAINNLNFALENMARSIRTDSSYRCESNSSFWTAGSHGYQGDQSPRDCLNGESVLVFESDTGDPGNTNDQWAFWLYQDKIFKGKNLVGGGGGEISQITADEIFIEDLKFYVEGAEVAGGLQPRVRLNVSGYAFVGDDQSGNPRRVDFDLQTTASQRILGTN